MLIRTLGIVLTCLYLIAPASAQTVAGMQSVIDRLDRLEKQNQELLTEIQELRKQLTPPQAATVEAAPAQLPAPPPSERLDVQESRTEELAQTKVGTFQRMPVTLTGMILFNAFHNGGYGGSSEVPLTAQMNQSPDSSGATFRQTIIGLRFDGPNLPGGGKASGSANFDFWGGTSAAGNNLFRVRTATIDLTWKNTTITAGQDKPIISPREPTSLAQVGLAPLSGAGNLWNWQPQLRIEQRFAFADQTGLRVQAGIYETAEAYPSNAPIGLAGSLEQHRPAYEGRVLFYHGSEKRRIEIAPGVHVSVSHVAGQSVSSQLGTLDWLVKPSNLIEFSGAMFRGTDDAGLGALRQGFTILPTGVVIPVHATGAWGQFAIFPASRISLHIFGGEEGDRASDLLANSVSRNLTYAANIVYKLAPNVLTALEVSQTRTDYITSGLRLNNHYDLAFAYLFKRRTQPRYPVATSPNQLRHLCSVGLRPASFPLIALILQALLLSTTLQSATVSGTIELHESRIASVARGRDYSGVVVSLQPVNQPMALAPEKHAVMLQKNKMFTPHILPVVAGTRIDFPNADPIFHNAFSSYSGQIFDVGLYPPGTSRSVRFERPGIVRVFCNIHPAMSAIILVLTTRLFVVTPHDGSFHFDVPPGSYDLAVFHERATEQSLQSLSRRILVTPDGVRLPPIAVSEAGYLMAPHKNKFGKDYDPPPDDNAFYPATHP